jgi:hypothetical protein
MFVKNAWYVAASWDEVSRKPMGRVLLDYRFDAAG